MTRIPNTCARPDVTHIHTHPFGTVEIRKEKVENSRDGGKLNLHLESSVESPYTFEIREERPLGKKLRIRCIGERSLEKLTRRNVVLQRNWTLCSFEQP